MKKFKGFRLSKFQQDKQVESIIYSEGLEWKNNELQMIEEKGRISTEFGDFVIVGEKSNPFDPEQIKNLDIDFGDDMKFIQYQEKQKRLNDLCEKLVNGEISLKQYIEEYTTMYPRSSESGA